MNERAKNLLTEILQAHIDDVLDDVAQFFANVDQDASELHEPVLAVLQINITELVFAAEELGLDFWKTAKEGGTDIEVMMFEDALAQRGMAWGWRPEPEKPKIEPEVRDESLQKLWCYRFVGDKGTHFGPVSAESVPALLALITSYHRNSIANGIEFWLTDNRTYLNPPEKGSGKTIYAYDQENGWRASRTA